jgi:pantothenate kinase-related protein Tda10
MKVEQPEPKKEKPMASLEINTQLFDGLSLSQRMNALIELTTERNKMREARVEAEEGQSSAYNGRYISRFVQEDAIDSLMRYLIDATVEKFGV